MCISAAAYNDFRLLATFLATPRGDCPNAKSKLTLSTPSSIWAPILPPNITITVVSVQFLNNTYE